MNDIKFWAITIIGILLLACVAYFIYTATTGSLFSDNPVKDWTIQEAIFYGFVVLSISTWLSK